MHDRDILTLKASRSNDSNDWLAFKRCRNSVNTEIKQIKELYYKKALYANEGDSRQTCRIINVLSSRKTTNCCVKEIKNNDKAICDSLELADSFNSHFLSIGPEFASEINSDNGHSHLKYIREPIARRLS